MERLNSKMFAMTIILSLGACGDAPEKYVFDHKDYKENKEKYSSGIGKGFCGFMVNFFEESQLKRVLEGKKVDFKKEGFTPVSFNRFKDKVEWINVGKDSLIENGEIKIDAGNKDKGTTPFKIIDEGEVLFLNLKVEKMDCKFPFKKVG